MRNYNVNHANKSIEITKAFKAKSDNPITEEFKTLKALLSAYTDYAVLVKPANKNKGNSINYEEMEKRLIASGNKENLDLFNTKRANKETFFEVRAWFYSLGI